MKKKTNYSACSNISSATDQGTHICYLTLCIQILMNMDSIIPSLIFTLLVFYILYAYICVVYFCMYFCLFSHSVCGCKCV